MGLVSYPVKTAVVLYNHIYISPLHVSFSLPVCFKVFDVDRDGVLSRDELHEMVVALLEVWKDNRTDALPVSSHTLSIDVDLWISVF